jgi:cytochrome c-type biogenesis protein CcmH
MTRLLAVALLGFASLLHAPAQAGIEPLAFASPEEEERFRELTEELRCPKCQNQSIADSDAPIAHDLRIRTLDLMHQGMSDGEIVDHLTERYGEFIHYRPAFSGATLVLWVSPVLLLVVVMTVLLLRRRRLAAQPAAPADTHARAAEILRRHGGPGDDA